MKSKKLSLLLLGVFSLTVILGGCNKKTETVSTSTSGKKTISLMLPLVSTTAPKEGNELEKGIEKLTGDKVKISWIPNSQYSDKVSITMASNNIPNVMVVQEKDGATVSNVSKGAYWKLGDYISSYPNLAKADENVRANASFNGDTYGIYRARDIIRSCIGIRKDWLDKLGLKVPTTIDEFTNVLDKFTNADPDGNGKKDTYGMIVPKWPAGLNTGSPFDQMAVWFGAPNKNKVVDGKVTPDFMTDEYMKSLDYFKMLYDKGYMNNDFAVFDSAKWDEPFINGKCGVIVDTQSRIMRLSTKMNEKYGNDGKNGDSYIVMAGAMKGSKENHILPTTGYSGMLMVPKQGVKDEKELKIVLDFLDKLNSKEGTILLNNGVEGVHYKLENGKYIPSEDKTLIAEIAAYSQLGMGTNFNDYYKVSKGSQLEKDRDVINKEEIKNAVFDPTAPLISDVLSKKGAQLQNIMADARIKYIAGQITKEQYKSAQEQWLNTGGKEVIDDLSKLYKEHKK